MFPALGFAAALLFLIPVSLLSHVLFSWIGFNPTDDGVVLAATRRLLIGQVPHLGFISIRPAVSSLLWLPQGMKLSQQLGPGLAIINFVADAIGEKKAVNSLRGHRALLDDFIQQPVCVKLQVSGSFSEFGII